MTAARVLITAGANGIGRAIAERFLADGARVFVCDVDRAALDRLREAHPEVITHACNLLEREAIDPMVQKALGELGGLDVLVNNAGLGGPTVPTEALAPPDWDQVMAINLDATFLVTRAAIPALKEAGGGSIVIMSSVAGRFGYPNRIAYATSKWGLIGFAKTLAIELGSHAIRVNALLPGAVDGPRFQAVLEGRAQVAGRGVGDMLDEALANQSLKHLVDPRHVADLAAFLASPSGRSISGQTLSMDCDMQRT